MNQRIEELYCQATYQLGKTGNFTQQQLIEKFAELILLQATDIVYDLLEDNTGAEVVVRVKEHFGVE